MSERAADRPPGVPEIDASDAAEGRAGVPRVEEAVTLIGRYVDEGMFRAAVEECYQLIERAPYFLPGHLLLGKILRRQERLQEASEKLKRVASTYESRGEMEEAVDAYRRVLEATPLDLSAQRRLVELLAAAEDVEGALEQLLVLGDSHCQLADPEAALRAYAEALDLAESSWDPNGWKIRVQRLIGDLGFHLLDRSMAMSAYQEILRLDPDDARSRMRLVEMCLADGKPHLAFTWLDEMMDRTADEGPRDQAIGFLRGMVRANPELPELRVRLAQLYGQAGHWRRAVAQLEWAGKLFWQAGREDEAKEALQSILRANPEKASEYRKRLGLAERPRS